MVKNSEIDDLRLDGGRLCLNYTNTIYDRTVSPQRDYLGDTLDVIAWASHAGIIDRKQRSSLTHLAKSDSGRAVAFFDRAMELRELLFKIFDRISKDELPENSDLDGFNATLTNYLSHLVIVQTDDGFVQGWHFDNDDLDLILAAIAKDAYDVILQDDHRRIKKCPNCGWLFYDSSKNGMRRWCSMQTCGSNVKARKWYHRHK